MALRHLALPLVGLRGGREQLLVWRMRTIVVEVVIVVTVVVVVVVLMVVVVGVGSVARTRFATGLCGMWSTGWTSVGSMTSKRPL